MPNSQNKKCRIAVDAMGGDFAPANTVVGAIDASAADNNIQLLLVGDKDKIKKVLADKNLQFPDEQIVHANEVIDMSDSPTAALKSKPNSSIVVGAKLVKDGKADGFISAGNTGAMMAASTLIIGRIKGVSRPTIGSSFPTQNGDYCSVYDVGASVDSKPSHLYEYALMGSIYAKEMHNIPKPTIGIMSVGEEKSKGNELTFATHELLSNSELNYVGNVEGRDVLKGTVNIIVCDGFVGNIILKLAESTIGLLKSRIKKYAEKGIINKLKALVVKGVFKEALSDMDYQSYGGVPLLGVNGISIIGHGSSSELAIKNMVLKAKEMFDKQLLQKFEEALKDYAKSK
jgi:glycerol-3-phosphate acyltransferase PlsX